MHAEQKIPPAGFSAPLLLAVLLLIAFLPSFQGSWHYDDYHHIVDNPHLKKLTNIPSFFLDSSAFSRNPGSVNYRPLLMVTHAIDRAIWGGDPFGPHLVNFTLHLFTTWGIYFLLFRLTALYRPVYTGTAPSRVVPAACALAFGLHPVHVETVTYLSSRSSGLVTLFLVYSFLFYLGPEADPGKNRAHSNAVSAILFGCALLTKESAAIFGIMLLAYHWTRADSSREFLRGLPRTIPHATLTIFYLLLRHAAIPSNLNLTAQFGPIRPYGNHLLTQARAVFNYLWKILFPVNLSIDRPYRFSETLSDPWAWLAVLGLAAIATTIPIMKARRQSLAAMGIVWFLLGLAPTSLVRLKVPLNDHRLYLPMVGLAIATAGTVPALVCRRDRLRAVVIAAATGILLLFGTGTWNYARFFHTEETLWARVLRVDGENHRALNNLGVFYLENGDRTRSELYLNRALAVAPSYAQAYFNLSRLMLEEGRIEKAESLAREAVRYDATPASIKLLGDVLSSGGRKEEALKSYNDLLSKDPMNAEAWANRGNVLTEMGSLEQAMTSYEQAVTIDPTLPHPYYGRALILEALGRNAEAEADMKRFLRLWPNRGDSTAQAAESALVRIRNHLIDP